ncbi:MAG: hypothetical protein K0R38_4373 [Polyangiaceae bacterium]|jgi:hypothetical protein|nr:hypothetical protein [Polyangiaceae bacterium]
MTTGGVTSGGTTTGGSGSSSGGNSGLGCAGKTYKLCEDFEAGDGTTLPAGWTRKRGYGAESPDDQVISTEEFRSGAKALMSTSDTKGISRIEKSLASLGATATKHWGRVFYKVKVPAGVTPSAYFHVTFVGLFGASENRVVDTVQEPGNTPGYSMKHQWLYNNPNDQGGKDTAYDWEFDDQWHCAEWFVDVSTKSYRFFHDAEEVDELAFTGQEAQMSAYTSILVGATHYQDEAVLRPFVMWIDDLAINDTQVGCQ